MKLRQCVLVMLVVVAADRAAYGDDTDDFIRQQMEAQNLPGLSLAVIRGGEVVKAAGYGYADRLRMTEVTPDTAFHIGSISKPLVATLVMRLAEKGRLGLDEPITRYLADAPPDWSRITLRHLLTHTSGIIRDAPDFDPQSNQTDSDQVRSAATEPLRFTPGERREYSNAGYAVVGEVIRAVTGQRWPAMLADEVLDPAGMTRTYSESAFETIPNRARGYVDNNLLNEAPIWTAEIASGGLLSSALDLAKWDIALRNETLLTEAQQQETWAPVVLNDGTTYSTGIGWELQFDEGDHRSINHSGQLPGFRAEYVRYIDDDVTIIILMNLDDLDWGVIVGGLARIHLPPDAR